MLPFHYLDFKANRFPVVLYVFVLFSFTFVFIQFFLFAEITKNDKTRPNFKVETTM